MIFPADRLSPVKGIASKAVITDCKIMVGATTAAVNRPPYCHWEEESCIFNVNPDQMLNRPYADINTMVFEKIEIRSIRENQNKNTLLKPARRITKHDPKITAVQPPLEDYSKTPINFLFFYLPL